MKSSTDRVVRRGAIVVIVSLMAAVSLTSLVLVSPTWRDRARREFGWSHNFEVGSASGLPVEWIDDARPTIVIFVSGSCEACRLSAPFHRALRAAGGTAGLRVLTALTSASDDPSAYAGSESLAPGDVRRFDAPGSRLRVVPTILIVDRRGVVLEKKEGVLPVAEQHALLETLKKLLPL